jgi:hypothetical protein
MRTFNLACSLRHTALIALIALIWSADVHAEGEATVHPPGGRPPAEVQRVAVKEAVWRRRGVDQEADLHPDTKSFAPQRLVTQKIVDFRYPGWSAWLLLYSVAEVDPRAHTPISQLVMVSSKDPTSFSRSRRDGIGPGMKTRRTRPKTMRARRIMRSWWK